MSYYEIENNVICAFNSKYRSNDISTFTLSYVVDSIVKLLLIYSPRCPVGLPDFHYDLVLSIFRQLVQLKPKNETFQQFYNGPCKYLTKLLLQKDAIKIVFRSNGKLFRPNSKLIYKNCLKKKLRLYRDIHVLIMHVMTLLSKKNYAINNKYLEQTVNEVVRLYVQDFFFEGTKHYWIELVDSRYVGGFVSLVLKHSVVRDPEICCLVS